MTKRYYSIDIIRGFAILSIIFLHPCFAHYRNITKIDFNNPPLSVTIIGFLLMWSGLFAMISMIANTSNQFSRMKEGLIGIKTMLYYFFSGGILIVLFHYFYFLLLGPVVLDFEKDNHKYSLISGFLHNGFFNFDLTDRFFYNSSLSMIGWNLIIIGAVCYFLMKRFGNDLVKITKYIGIIGSLIIFLSIIRIPLFPLIDQVSQSQNFFVSAFFNLLINKNDPLLPYLGFGFFGAMIGLLITYELRTKKIVKYLGIIASVWMILGIVANRLFPDTMLERSVDGLWFSIMLIQLGLFIWFTVAALTFFDYRKEGKQKRIARRFKWVRQFGMVSLTVFMLETPLGEMNAKLWNLLIPGWDLSINKVMLFGLFNIFVWFIIVQVWWKGKFKYSFEWLTVMIFEKIGRKSNKVKVIENFD